MDCKYLLQFSSEQLYHFRFNPRARTGRDFDKYVTKATEKEYNELVNLVTCNNIKITGIFEHLVDRAIERKVSAEEVKKALLNPLKIGKIKAGEKGNSQEFFGENGYCMENKFNT
ncbi:MAG: hypothetical protein PHC81_06895 [Clostridia bacterium]|nr:hypothetical protein [Clostridia bacterium]